jgi:hypothetical protein
MNRVVLGLRWSRQWRQNDVEEPDAFHDRAGPGAHGAGSRAGNSAGQSMSFLVSSTGSGMGGNLGGLAWADKHCQALAAKAGVGNRTSRAYLSTSMPDVKTGVEDDGAGLRGAVLGVPGGWRRPRGPCRPRWLWGLRWLWLASHRNQDRPPEGGIATP